MLIQNEGQQLCLDYSMYDLSDSELALIGAIHNYSSCSQAFVPKQQLFNFNCKK